MSTEHNQENQEHTTENNTQEHAQDTPETVQDDTQQADEPKGNKAHRDAAKYRTQLRETETQLETITAHRDQLARQTIEHLLPADMPAQAFWKLTEGIENLMTEDGLVDPEKVAETATQLRKDLKLPNGPVIPGQEKRAATLRAANQFQQAFAPK